MELVFAMGLIATLSSIAIPQVTASLDDYQAQGAARYLSSRFQRTRMEAVTRTNEVALKFVESDGRYAYRPYADGDGDGVRTLDINQGVDRPLGPAESLTDRFPGIDFGVLTGLPAVDAGSAPPGADPIKLGSSNLLSFSANGTSSSGSLYIRGRTAQYVVRVYGVTAKTRLLKFMVNENTWKPL